MVLFYSADSAEEPLSVWALLATLANNASMLVLSELAKKYVLCLVAPALTMPPLEACGGFLPYTAFAVQPMY